MTLTFLYLSTLFSIAPFALVAGHIALWDVSMFGRCGNNNQCVNTEQPVDPLQDMPFDQWWWHGYLDFPPPPDAVMSLPAGGSVTVQLAGNVAFTALGQHPDVEWPGGAAAGTKNESIVSNTYWNDGDAGNLHTTGKADIAGCALSIAYTDDPRVVRPEDMVVFSVQHECVWHRDTVFDVPAAMPPCPNGKCMCSWWWIHNSDGGSDQDYQTAFQCNVTHSAGQQISTTPVGKPVPPVNCTGEPDKCIKGPKMPMYWKNTECNNMPNPGHFAPTYGDNYGFFQGAQNDIFETINESNWTCPQSKAPGVFATLAKNQAPNNSENAPKSPVSSSSSVAPSSTVSLVKSSSTVVSAPTKVSSSQIHEAPTSTLKPSSAPPSQSTHATTSSVAKPVASSAGESEHQPSQSKSESASLPQMTGPSVCRHSPRNRRAFSGSLSSRR